MCILIYIRGDFMTSETKTPSYEQIQHMFNAGHYTAVLEQIDDAIHIAKQHNERLTVAKYYDMKVDCYKFIQLPTRAHETLTEFHQFIEQFGTTESAIWFHICAISLWENGSVAVDDIIQRHIAKLSTYVHQTDDVNLKRRIYGTTATHYMNLQQFEQAIDYLELAFLYAQLTVEQQSERDTLQYSTIIDLVYLNTMLGRFAIAERVNEVVYTHLASFSGYQQGLVLQNYGYLLMQQGKFEAAIIEFSKLVEHTDHYVDTSLKAIAYQYMCECMEAIEHPDLVMMLKQQIKVLNDLIDEGQAALALDAEEKIQHNSFMKKSSIDSLTNVFTRAYFEECATRMFAERQPNETLAFGIIDVDYFKKINDTYGHLAGDEALLQVGRYLQEFMLRQQAIVCRYGGDEFLILFTTISAEEAEAKVQQLYAELNMLTVQTANRLIDLSFSLGFVTIHNDAIAVPQAIQYADEALYEVKRNGRSNYAFYSSEH